MLAIVTSVAFSAACSGGNAVTPAPVVADKQQAGSPVNTPDDDSADKPAPVAGAYLTCMIQNPKPEDTEYNAGCQLRDRDHKPVELKQQDSARWTYRAASDKPLAASDVAVLDLSKSKKNYFFQVAYSIKRSQNLGLTGGPDDFKKDPKLLAFIAASPCLVSTVATGCGAPLGRYSNASAQSGVKHNVYEVNQNGQRAVVPPTAAEKAEIQTTPVTPPENAGGGNGILPLIIAASSTKPVTAPAGAPSQASETQPASAPVESQTPPGSTAEADSQEPLYFPEGSSETEVQEGEVIYTDYPPY